MEYIKIGIKPAAIGRLAGRRELSVPALSVGRGWAKFGVCFGTPHFTYSLPPRSTTIPRRNGRTRVRSL
jgi:hypothetical protein